MLVIIIQYPGQSNTALMSLWTLELHEVKILEHWWDRKCGERQWTWFLFWYSWDDKPLYMDFLKMVYTIFIFKYFYFYFTKKKKQQCLQVHMPFSQCWSYAKQGIRSIKKNKPFPFTSDKTQFAYIILYIYTYYFQNLSQKTRLWYKFRILPTSSDSRNWRSL